MELSERLAWIARGFRIVTYVEVSCPTCGVFRSASPEPDAGYPCPMCKTLIQARIIGEGVTTRDDIPWERTAEPFSASASTWRMQLRREWLTHTARTGISPPTAAATAVVPAHPQHALQKM